ncbi:MAG: hypothetical protein HOP16_13980 [Acidobacteria bacterium]|nr:hypothetical protein [Acidobacteriota bacterium]
MAAVVMLWWTWGTWPDLFIDFGRELYLPWQITEGKVLYRDLASFNGPLSPYVNAAWFRLFGVGLWSLVVGNVLIAAGLTVMLYKLLMEIGGRASAIVGGLIFVVVFWCAQLSATGNFNFITPYSHELTHGIALSTACVLASVARLDAGSKRRMSPQPCLARSLCTTAALASGC